MNQTASITSSWLTAPIRGALFMVAAALCFAAINSGVQWATTNNQIGSTSVAFYQYLFALVFALPWIWREGIKSLATNNLGWHLFRVALSALGVQVWIYALGHVQIWQAIALVMTAPFFVVAGAGLFLKENITVTRVLATLAGFAGAMIILEPWSTSFTLVSLLPLLAAVLWAGASLITKFLTRTESSETITVYLLLLLTPINGVLLGFSGFTFPTGNDLWILVGLGVITAAAQYFITRAYAAADASFLQPFDDLKLPANVLVSWLIFAYAPSVNFWPGAALIVGASLYIATRENRAR